MLEISQNTVSLSLSAYKTAEDAALSHHLSEEKQIWLKLLEKTEKSETTPLLIEEFEQYFINLCQQKADKKAKKRN